MTTDATYSRPSAYEADDGTIHYRASALGYCMGALARARLGVTPAAPPDAMLERYQEGHGYEAVVLVAGLGAAGYRSVTAVSRLSRIGQVLDSGQVETTLAWGNKVVTCHPDAIVETAAAPHQLRVCEVKFLGESMYEEVTRAGVQNDTAYGWQASIEMLTTKLPMLYIVGEKIRETGSGDEVVRLGRIWTAEWDQPHHSVRDVKARVLEIEGYVARGEMPACPVPFDYPCGYWDTHETRVKPDLEDEMLAGLVESYDRAKSHEGLHHAEADRIKGDIADRLIELKVDSGTCSGWDIAWVKPRPGNVSWSKWAKDVRKKWPEVDLSEDGYRGAEVAGGVRMSKVRDDA